MDYTVGILLKQGGLFMNYNKSNITMYHNNAVFSIEERFFKENCAIHWHNNFEMEFVIGGSGYQILNGKKYELKKSAFYILNNTDFHEIHVTEPLCLTNIRFDESLIGIDILREFLTLENNIFFYANVSEYKQIDFFLKTLLNEYNKKDIYNKNVISNLLECILIFAIRKFKSAAQNHPQNVSLVQKVLLYLHAHFRKNPSCTETAEIFCVNPNYLSTVFHKETGMTYKQYLNKIKINYAKKLIVSTDVSITEISYACGFSTFAHFLRIFKMHFGITPGQLRENLKQK